MSLAVTNRGGVEMWGLDFLCQVLIEEGVGSQTWFVPMAESAGDIARAGAFCVPPAAMQTDAADSPQHASADVR